MNIGHTGMDLIKEIKQIFGNYDFKTQILVASIRHPQHVVDAGKIGADVCKQFPAAVLGKMLNHTLTEKGLKAFLDDWEKLKIRKIQVFEVLRHKKKDLSHKKNNLFRLSFFYE